MKPSIFKQLYSDTANGLTTEIVSNNPKPIRAVTLTISGHYLPKEKDKPLQSLKMSDLYVKRILNGLQTRSKQFNVIFSDFNYPIVNPFASGSSYIDIEITALSRINIDGFYEIKDEILNIRDTVIGELSKKYSFSDKKIKY
jgi:hypothetical protein